MESINVMNYYFTGIPLLLIVGGWLFKSDIFLIGLLFTMLTGLFQVIVGLLNYMNNEHSKPLYAAYLVGVITFFLLWLITNRLWIFVIPPLLALFLSVLVYIDAKNQQS